jgi:hypothetical protein
VCEVAVGAVHVALFVVLLRVVVAASIVGATPSHGR